MFSGKPATVLEDLADFRAPPYAQDAWQALVHRTPLPPSPVARVVTFSVSSVCVPCDGGDSGVPAPTWFASD